MENHNKPLSRADYQFINNQKARIVIHLLIGCGIIYILANFFMLFTNIVFFIGIIPIVVGLGYSIYYIKTIIKETREYWKNN